jgi:hypothetical protein
MKHLGLSVALKWPLPLVAECQDALLALAPSYGCESTMASLAMKSLISLLDKHQLHHRSVQSCLLEHLGVWQEKRLRTGLSFRIIIPGQMPGCKHGKQFIGRPCKKRADDLLKLDRHQLKLTAAILTGHATVRGHLRTIGLYDGDPSCRLCGLQTETVQNLVCCCEALSCQRYNAFGEFIIAPKAISRATVCVSLSETQGYLNCAELSF